MYYDFTIEDTGGFGDGLGSKGKYEVVTVDSSGNNRKVLVSGGRDFQNSETNKFLIGDAPILPTRKPSVEPTRPPTSTPRLRPTRPATVPTSEPTANPTANPTAEPTRAPTVLPTIELSTSPTKGPTPNP
eukprot:jgi/Psemu1/209731/e_gw1.509.32.1